MQQTRGKRPRGEREKILFLKHDKSQSKWVNHD